MKLEDAAERWKEFFCDCLSSRIRAENLDSLILPLEDTFNTSGNILASSLLSGYVCTAPDPLIVSYFERLLQTDRISVDETLQALSAEYQASITVAEENISSIKHNVRPNISLEDIIFTRLATVVANGTRPKTVQEAQKVIRSLSHWITMLIATDTSQSILQVASGSKGDSNSQASQIRESFGIFVVSALENPKMQGVIVNSIPKGEPSVSLRVKLRLS